MLGNFILTMSTTACQCIIGQIHVLDLILDLVLATGWMKRFLFREWEYRVLTDSTIIENFLVKYGLDNNSGVGD